MHQTTLLKLIAGLEVPNAGTIRLGGREVMSPQDSGRRGFLGGTEVPQEISIQKIG